MPGVHFYPSFRRNPTKRTNTIIRAEEGFGTTRAKQAVQEERLFMVAGSLRKLTRSRPTASSVICAYRDPREARRVQTNLWKKSAYRAT